MNNLSLTQKILLSFREIKRKRFIARNNRYYIVFKKFSIIFYAYLLILFFWLVAKFYQKEWTCVVENEWGMGAGFYISWLASFSEDIIFFGLIGLLSLRISTKLPQDEEFSSRVNSLANGKNAGEHAANYIRHEVQELLKYNDEFEAILTLKSLDKEGKNIEIHAEITANIANMCKDIDLPLRTTKAIVNPDILINDNYGYISHFVIYDKDDPSRRDSLCESDIIILNEKLIKEEGKNGMYIMDTKHDITKDGISIWKFCFNIWCPFNQDKKDEKNWYFIKTLYFTENIKVKLINKLDIDIKSAYRTKTRKYSLDKGNMSYKNIPLEKDNILIKSKSEELIISNIPHYKDDFKLFFYKL